jgi:hypothetical protein
MSEKSPFRTSGRRFYSCQEAQLLIELTIYPVVHLPESEDIGHGLTISLPFNNYVIIAFSGEYLASILSPEYPQTERKVLMLGGERHIPRGSVSKRGDETPYHFGAENQLFSITRKILVFEVGGAGFRSRRAAEKTLDPYIERTNPEREIHNHDDGSEFLI